MSKIGEYPKSLKSARGNICCLKNLCCETMPG